MTNLPDALLGEMRRVRDDVMPSYIEIGAPGALALTLMRRALDRAGRALVDMDIVEMSRTLAELKGFST